MGLALALALAPAAVATAAKPRVPVGFLGVNPGGGTLLEHADLEHEYDLMLDAGVQSVRQPFQWEFTQPYPTWADVPPDQAARFRDEGGMPTDWTVIDRQVAAAARRRIEVLPIVHATPGWAAREPGQFSSPPRDPEQFAAFAALLSRRYGPTGAFWREHPELPRMPIRDWQIWNEPNTHIFWRQWPWEGDYVALLRAVRPALRAVDKRARIVLGGLPNESWKALARIYRVGGRPYFDVVALHPFTGGVDGVLEIARRNRAVMARNHDARKTFLITETAWTSSRGRTSTGYTWETTEAGQAGKVRHLLRLLARVRRSARIERVFWYTWMTTDSSPGYSFDYAGLRRLRGAGPAESKPALAAFKQTALELSGCRRKMSRADRCG
ncbi:MAG: polysaccharide biosynthesis protein PslG [Thermoleophilales bacterium]|nr:polysaccharide biosynthesis protein PslG [Thermoleophilales bacterium]